MAKPGKRREIERESEGKPLSDILTELYSKHGSQTEVARILGVSQASISLWLAHCGLSEKRIIVAVEEGQQPQAAK